jgi:hypothetical protein
MGGGIYVGDLGDTVLYIANSIVAGNSFDRAGTDYSAYYRGGPDIYGPIAASSRHNIFGSEVNILGSGLNHSQKA